MSQNKGQELQLTYNHITLQTTFQWLQHTSEQLSFGQRYYLLEMFHFIYFSLINKLQCTTSAEVMWTFS